MVNRILVLHDNTKYTLRYLFPLLRNTELLRDFGFHLAARHYDCWTEEDESDYCIITHDCLENEEQNVRLSALVALRNKCNKLIWLDTSDSTGTPVFDVLPFVDVYLKKQLLKDKTLYTEQLYSLRYFSDYYHKNYGVLDPEIPQRVVLDLRFKDKLKLAWNILICDVPSRRSLGDRLKDALSLGRSYHFVSPQRKRPHDISFRGSMEYIPSVSYQRERILELLRSRKDITYPEIGKVISQQQYFHELQDSRCVISPFGWGEICWREAECWINGAALLKPDMSHLETWPDLFVEGETYEPIRWDFLNLDSILDKIMQDKSRYLEIASCGQELYKRYMARSGDVMLIEHFLKQISYTKSTS